MLLKKYRLLINILILISLSSCSSGKVKTVYNKLHERNYLIFGRVLTFDQRPVENCKITLVKRKVETSLRRSKFDIMWKGTFSKLEQRGNFEVIKTDRGGDYSFIFEPQGANDIWLYFDAVEQGYEPRLIELDKLMKPDFFSTPGNSPINIDIVMENKTTRGNE